jgi:hypothetical protein
MKTLNADGVEVEAWVETIKEGWGAHVCMSDLREATLEDIDKFKADKCDHSMEADRKEQLIFDKQGWPYDLRYCVVCGASLGLV